jgi:hypothetical protein
VFSLLLFIAKFGQKEMAIPVFSPRFKLYRNKNETQQGKAQ